jgi:small subunit ribosomal protein S17
VADQETIQKRAQERDERRAKNARARRAYRAKQKQKRAATASDRVDTPEQSGKEHGPGRPKVRQGIVTSAKADKTIVVRIDSARRHRMYKKIIRDSSSIHAHDEQNDANEGDLVRVIECRPMSRTKRWRLTDVLERSR